MARKKIIKFQKKISLRVPNLIVLIVLPCSPMNRMIIYQQLIQMIAMTLRLQQLMRAKFKKKNTRLIHKNQISKNGKRKSEQSFVNFGCRESLVKIV